MFVKSALFIVVICVNICSAQILLFGKCVEVETMKYFNMDSFLGKWYEIQRYPAWYEREGACSFKDLGWCGRRVEVKHSFVKDGVQFILHVNSTYAPGDDAVFNFPENNIDPIGIPMTVISTDYTNYALVYGCKYKEDTDIKYLSAWILSREPSLPEDLLQKAREDLNAIPNGSVTYLQSVMQDEELCRFHWTANIQAVNITADTDRD